MPEGESPWKGNFGTNYPVCLNTDNHCLKGKNIALVVSGNWCILSPTEALRLAKKLTEEASKRINM